MANTFYKVRIGVGPIWGNDGPQMLAALRNVWEECQEEEIPDQGADRTAFWLTGDVPPFVETEESLKDWVDSLTAIVRESLGYRPAFITAEFTCLTKYYEYYAPGLSLRTTSTVSIA